MDESQFSDPAEDDAYSALYRPQAPAQDSSPHLEPEDEEPIVFVEEVAVVPVVAPIISSPKADTGRLFRSVGVHDAPGALAALSRSEAAHLRTINSGSTPVTPEVEVVASTPERAEEVSPSSIAVASLLEPNEGFAAPITNQSAPASSPSEGTPMSKSRRNDPGLSPLGVYVLVIGATMIAGFLDSFISGAGLGWLTGVVFLGASIYCAVKVRVSDASVAVIAPPIAFGLAALTVGQLGQSRAGGALVSAFVNGFTTLADNWFWVIGTTVAALAIVVVRSRR